MAEFTSIAPVAVPAGQNIPFTETPVRGNGCIIHREGSGLVTLRGNTNQCRAIYEITYNGNIAIPTGGTVGPISVAIVVDGEALGSATAIVTPAAVENFFNVSAVAQVCVPRGCCVTVGVRNPGAEAITAQNNNLTVSRIA